MSASGWDPHEELKSLRWREDMIVTNDFGERVWLKPLLVNERYEEDPNGRRIGITDCCFADDPCLRHAALAAVSVKADGT